MGNSSSVSGHGSATTNSDDDAICLDCDKKNQKDLPQQDPLSSKGQPCAGVYEKVCECMNHNKGQISPCAEEWESFRRCHQQEQEKQ